ncbi:phage tail protein [Domibacillus aminovorans]|uniref:phage tail protein n=1 Tax=Domibacillus aminovorans TaxID=29332 RepID=UPI0012FE7B7B|nr:phage tail protein [Domibacillus aminovorans]
MNIILSVTHLDGRCEPLALIKNPEIEEEVNGVFSLTFTSFLFDRKNSNIKNPGHELLEEECIVDFNGQEFKIKNVTGNGTSKNVRATHIFFELTGHNVEGIQGGTRTAEEQASFILAGTGWTYEVQGVILPQLFLDAFGNSNAVQLIRLMCETLKCEVQIMPGRHLIFAQEIGPDEDFQFRFKHNISSIAHSVDSTDLYTAIKGYGSNNLAVEYQAPTVQLYGVIYADPVYDDNFSVSADLTEHIKQELGDRYLPKISIDVSIAELNEQGYKGIPDLGERVWLIHPKLDLLLKTRVMKRQGNPLVKGGMKVTLSNVKAAFSDVLTETIVDLDASKKEYRSKIEQTNERITLEVERLDGEVLEVYARIQIESDRITSEVGRLDGEVLAANSRITQLADSVTIEVNRIDEDLGELETQVQINAGEISSKVSYTDYNGVEMISRINQTASAVTISASKIDLNGITTVADSLWLGSTIGGEKNIYFSNFSRITSLNNGDLELEANGDLHLSALASLSKVRFDNDVGVKSIVDLSTAQSVIYGNNKPSSVSYADEAGYASSAGSANTAGNAWLLNGLSDNAFSRSGHVHPGNQYVKPWTTQTIELRVDTGNGRLYVYNGSFEGYVNLI